MATQAPAPAGPRPSRRDDDFRVIESTRSLGRNLPQKVGRLLWGPSFLMALAAFGVGIGLAIWRASLINDGAAADVDLIESLRHYTEATIALGFAFVLSGVTFAIARILGVFRTGGGELQEAVGSRVQTLRMPWTAKGMLAFMAMGMMAIVVPAILHYVVGATVVSGSAADLTTSEEWFTALEGVRRLGVGMMLFGILLGLGTIITVIRFQTTRIREIARGGDTQERATAS